MAIKKQADLCGPFNLMFPARKENLSGFYAELDWVIFIALRLDANHLWIGIKTLFHKFILFITI